jgi:hypothetical protein
MHCSKVFVRRYPLVYRQHLCNIQRSHCVCRTIELLTMAPTDIYLPFGFLQHLLHPTLHSTLHWSSAASSSSRLYIYTQTAAPSALSGERAIIPALHKSYTYIYQGSPTEPPVLSRELATVPALHKSDYIPGIHNSISHSFQRAQDCPFSKTYYIPETCATKTYTSTNSVDTPTRPAVSSIAIDITAQPRLASSMTN